MFLPFAVLAFAFSYLPLYGWRYAFYDYTAGGTLSSENFVGFKWFTTLIANETTRNDVIRVLRNTLAMSSLGILTSWLPLAFAIFLSEIKNMRVRRFIQTFTTIPNFISWVWYMQSPLLSSPRTDLSAACLSTRVSGRKERIC